MIEVFKTNVQKTAQANKLIAMLGLHLPQSKINFDLADCDKILRIDGEGLIAEKVENILKDNGFVCNVLD